jgi:hypothetical protein
MYFAQEGINYFASLLKGKKSYVSAMVLGRKYNFQTNIIWWNGPFNIYNSECKKTTFLVVLTRILLLECGSYLPVFSKKVNEEAGEETFLPKLD